MAEGGVLGQALPIVGERGWDVVPTLSSSSCWSLLSRHYLALVLLVIVLPPIAISTHTFHPVSSCSWLWLGVL